MLASRPPSSSAPTHNPHSTRCQPAPNCPRLRALALFGRRFAERAEGLVIAGVQKPAQNLRRTYVTSGSQRWRTHLIVRRPVERSIIHRRVGLEFRPIGRDPVRIVTQPTAAPAIVSRVRQVGFGRQPCTCNADAVCAAKRACQAARSLRGAAPGTAAQASSRITCFSRVTTCGSQVVGSYCARSTPSNRPPALRLEHENHRRHRG